MRTLGAIRSDIDAIDEEIAEALARRSKLVSEAKKHKRSAGLGAVDPAREAAIVADAIRTHEETGGLYPKSTIAGIWDKILRGAVYVS